MELDITKTPIFKKAVDDAVAAIKDAGNSVNANLTGFTIDETYCDWRDADGKNVETAFVVGVIDDFAAKFAEYSEPLYGKVVISVCDAINQRF